MDSKRCSRGKVYDEEMVQNNIEARLSEFEIHEIGVPVIIIPEIVRSRGGGDSEVKGAERSGVNEECIVIAG